MEIGGDRSSHYKLLDLPKDASADQVRAAYRSLARRWHPDKNPPASKREAEAKFAAITRAYEALRREKVEAVFTRKPPPIERKLECTLEELFAGCRKEVRYTRDVVGRNGLIFQKDEVQSVKVKPGWRKGHTIILKEKGDERPGSVPSDVILVISEKEHPYLKRVQNDLVLKVEVPLVNALTGWTFTFRRLDGSKMTCIFEDEIIYPGYQKVLKGEGMPIANEKGVRGGMRIKFSIKFPKILSTQQKMEITSLLGGCK